MVSGFAPAETPRIAVANDGTLAAIHEPSRITVLSLPACTAIAEVGVDPEAGATEVAWVGARLAVLSRYAAHSTVHLLDPNGPRTVAEIRLESPMRLMAAVGTHVLAFGAQGAAVLSAGESHLTPYQFPSRTLPTKAGAAGALFVVALPGTIEEWDPQSRVPKRRLKLPKVAAINALGGSERVVWMTTQQDPTRIDVFALVNRGQPKFHALPEPIGYVASHPKSDLLACIGADSGKLFGVDLDGKASVKSIPHEGITRVEAAALVFGRTTSVLVAQARRPLALVSLDGREAEKIPAPPPAIVIADAPPPVVSSTLYGEVEPAPIVVEPPPLIAPPSAIKISPPTSVAMAAPAVSVADRFSSWRDRTRITAPKEPAFATAPTSSWRDELVIWTRSAIGATSDRNPPSIPAIETLAQRLAVNQSLYAGLAALYGAHLCGDDGIAPVDLARILGRNWDEALGRGQLAHSAVATFIGSRIRLATFAQRALDELHPATGSVVGTPGTIELLTACVVVAPASQPLGLVAEATLPLAGGAILAADPGADILELVREARAHGAVAMVRGTEAPGGTTIIFVVADEVQAEQLDLPRLS